jgi:hypothetical protein
LPVIGDGVTTITVGFRIVTDTGSAGVTSRRPARLFRRGPMSPRDWLILFFALLAIAGLAVGIFLPSKG